MDLTESTTTDASGRLLATTAMGIDFTDSPGALTGDVPFEIRGTEIDLDGVLSFAETAWPVVDWWCPEQ
jgi:hypothetical protein